MFRSNLPLLVSNAGFLCKATQKLRYYPEYGLDYYATFFTDPDGLRLEVMNFREVRRKIVYD